MSFDTLLGRVEWWNDPDRIPDEFPEKADELLSKIEPPALEVGCGKGRILARLPDGVGVDVSNVALKTLKDRGILNDVIQAEARFLPFRNGTFRTAYTYEVLMHIQEIDETVREMKRVASRVIAVENTKVKDRFLKVEHDWPNLGIQLIENL